MKLRKLTSVGVATAMLAAGIAMATPALAEPVSGNYAAVGSDTLEASMNALANGTTVTGSTVRVTVGGNSFGNYDAFPAGRIQTKSTGAYFARPAGSGAGVDALRASISGNAYVGTVITGQVDIARSSSSPKSADANAEGKLVYVPYGRDAVSYAYKAADSAAATVLGNLTAGDLTTIYNAATPTTISGITIKPRLPQKDSGTRSFFLKAIAVTSVGAAVPAGDNLATGPAENDATVLGLNEIIPFSVANWVAQSNNVAVNTIGSTGVQIGSPTGIAPFTGSGSALVPNKPFYDNTTFGRDTYLVVEYARINSTDAKYDAKLASLVTNLTSYGLLPSTPGAVKTKFGFLKASTTTVQRAFPNG